MDVLDPGTRSRYDAVVARAKELVVGLDFDGTLSPIVANPVTAWIHPEGPAVLAALASRVRAVALVTGRPARQVVELGRLHEVAAELSPGARFLVRGQYGNELWDSDTEEFTSPEVPPGLTAFVDALPGVLGEEDAADAFVEEKGLAVAVHTRRLDDPAAAFARLEPRLADLAAAHELTLEPGRLVLEVRASGMHKGHALRQVVTDYDAAGVLFIGDDLGDLEAFHAARSLRDQGLAALLVCSGSAEQPALAEVADLVVDGPDGVMALLRQLTEDADAAGSGR